MWGRGFFYLFIYFFKGSIIVHQQMKVCHCRNSFCLTRLWSNEDVKQAGSSFFLSVSLTRTHTHTGIPWYDNRERGDNASQTAREQLAVQAKGSHKESNCLRPPLTAYGALCRLLPPCLSETHQRWLKWEKWGDKSQWYGSPGSQALRSVFCFYPQLVKW